MARRVQWRRGTSAQHDTFTGAIAEITVDVTTGQLRVHNGSAPGGSSVNPILNAQWFGVRPSASAAANTTALQAVFDAASVLGAGTVELPSGSISFSGTVTTPSVGVTIRGTSNFRYGAGTLLQYTGAGTGMVMGSDSTRLSNLRLYTTTGAIGIDTNEKISLDFEYVEVSGFDDQFFSDNSFWLNWCRCTIQSKATGTSRGIHSNKNFNACSIDACTFIGVNGVTWNPVVVNTDAAGTSNGSGIYNSDFDGGDSATYAIDLYLGCGQFTVRDTRTETAGLRFLRHRSGAAGLVLEGNSINGSGGGALGVGLLLEGAQVEVGQNSWGNCTKAIEIASTASKVTIAARQDQVAVTTFMTSASTDEITDHTGTLTTQTSMRLGAAQWFAYKDSFTNLSTTPVALQGGLYMLGSLITFKLSLTGGHVGAFQILAGLESGVGYHYSASPAAAGGNCAVSETSDGVFEITVTGSAVVYTLTLASDFTGSLKAASLTSGVTTLSYAFLRLN